MADINGWRRKIDRIDDQIIKLLDRRTQCAVEIGKLKSATGAAVFDPRREAEVLARIGALSKALPRKSAEAIYREIFSAARAVEKPLSVSFLGPVGTFSDEAARRCFGSSSLSLPQPSFDLVVRAVEKGESDFGVLPVENSVEGPVNTVLDLLRDSPLTIVGEKTITAHQNLASRLKGIKGIKRLFSHQQPLGQCRRYISRALPNVEIFETASTAAAAEKAAKTKGSAAICSLAAAEAHGLNALDKNIEDSPNNQTRFVILAKQAARRTGHDKTSVAVTIKNRPGELHRLLGIFSAAKINLSKIISRPLPSSTWGYQFYIDLEGHAEDKAVSAALKRVSRMCETLKALGSYPREK